MGLRSRVVGIAEVSLMKRQKKERHKRWKKKLDFVGSSNMGVMGKFMIIQIPLWYACNIPMNILLFTQNRMGRKKKRE